MKFKVIHEKGYKLASGEKYYINQRGELFMDCDPHGVDMSGKRRIIPMPKEFKIVYLPEPTKEERWDDDVCSGMSKKDY